MIIIQPACLDLFHRFCCVVQIFYIPMLVSFFCFVNCSFLRRSKDFILRNVKRFQTYLSFPPGECCGVSATQVLLSYCSLGYFFTWKKICDGSPFRIITLSGLLLVPMLYLDIGCVPICFQDTGHPRV